MASNTDAFVINIVREQLNKIFIKLFNSTKDFIVIDNANNTIKIIQNKSNKSIIISMSPFTRSSILSSAKSWIEYLCKNITNAFLRSPIISQPVIDSVWIVSFKKSFISPQEYVWPIDIDVKEYYGKAYHGMCCIAKNKSIEMLKQKHGKYIESVYPNNGIKIQALKERRILNTSDLISISNTNQRIEPFVVRIGANHSSEKSGDGVGSLANRTDINVFVVDTGIAPHSDLNIVGGRNFTSSDINSWIDANGHGTHVAGIIGAKDNQYGIVGIAPDVRLWAIRVFDSNGSGSSTNLLSALNWILSGRNTVWKGKAIVNLSLGGTANKPLDDTVNNLANNGIIVCVAAGNNAINAINISPAKATNAITIGATEQYPSYTKLADYSNWGSSVDILSPGTNIYSTYLNNGYAIMSGTSMATPVVTGTVAILQNIITYPEDNTITYVNNVIKTILNNSAYIQPKNWDKTVGSNPRITVPVNKQPTTNISVWAGSF